MHKPNVVGLVFVLLCCFFLNKMPLGIKSCLENTSSAILSLCQTCPPSVPVHELSWKIFLLAGWSFTEPGSSLPTQALNQPQTLQGTPWSSRHPSRASLRRVHPSTSSQLRPASPRLRLCHEFDFWRKSEGQGRVTASAAARTRGCPELLSNHSRS